MRIGRDLTGTVVLSVLLRRADLEIGGEDERQRVGHDGEFDGKGAGGFAVKLRENFDVAIRMAIVLAKGMAGETRSFPDANVADAMKTAEPDCGKAFEQAEAVVSGVGDDFELIFEEARANGDAKRAAVVFRAADNDQSGVQLSFRRLDAKKWEAVREKLAKTSEPISENTDARFELRVDSVDDGAVGPRSADAKKIALNRKCGRGGAAGAPFSLTERDAREPATGDQTSGSGNVPRNAKLFGENVRGSGGKNGEGRFGAGDSVDDFVDGAVAAANDNHFAAAVNGIAGEFSGGASTGGGKEMGINSRGAKDFRSFFEGMQAARTAPAARGVVDDDGVADLFRNRTQVSNRR